jgi:hypothetical protein
MTAVSMWLFDEASSGQAPTSVLDSVASPVNLTPTYGATSAWSAIAAGDGLTGNNTAQRLRCVSANLSGTKIGTALHGLKKLAIEFVYTGAPSSGQVFIPFIIGADALGTFPFVFLMVESGGNVNVEMYATGIATGDTAGFIDAITLASPTVVRIDIDTAQAVAANRIKVWFNGAAQTVRDPAVIQDATFSIAATDKLYTHGIEGNFGEDGIIGTVYYLSLDNVVPSADNSTALLANNDTDPSGAPPAVVEPTPQTGLAFVGGMGGGF